MLRGELALSDMPRLAGLLANADGVVDVSLEFGIDEVGIRFMRGTLVAELQPLCQRCLEPMTVTVNTEVAFGLVEHDHQVEQLPMQYEALLVTDVPMRLAELIEDELMLSLPQVPMHDEAQCPARDWLPGQGDDEQDETERTANPFAVLADLKRKQD